MTTCPEILKGKVASEKWKNNNGILIIQTLIIFLKTTTTTKNRALGTIWDEIIFLKTCTKDRINSV